MIDEEDSNEQSNPPEGSKSAKIARGALQAVGGVLSVIAGAWSEGDQEKVNRFFEHWVRMLYDELKEKQETIIEIMIMARLDLQAEVISQRVESKGYQALVKKTFREWSGAESDQNRVYIRNILSNAAASSVSSEDVVRMYIDWINQYFELHFQVIGGIYNAGGITRGEIWKKLAKVLSDKIQPMRIFIRS